jgi:hypothetical protein
MNRLAAFWWNALLDHARSKVMAQIFVVSRQHHPRQVFEIAGHLRASRHLAPKGILAGVFVMLMW